MSFSTKKVPAPAAVRWYRRALSFAPASFRVRYEEEAVQSFETLLVLERTRRGRLAASRLWLRAMADAMGTVRRERTLHSRGQEAPCSVA